MKSFHATVKSSPFVILAPAGVAVPKSFRRVTYDPGNHERMLTEMQMLRGAVALQEGALQPHQLDSRQRHQMPGDYDCWHLLRVGNEGRIRGCARILVHSHRTPFSALRLAASAVAKSPEWKRQVRFTVEAEMALARLSAKMVVEPGGWVLDERLRGSQDAVSIALSAFAWSQLAGECLGYATATVKHGSSSILKRLGARRLQFAGTEIPRYFDPAYECEMELLKFETKALNARFEPMMNVLRENLAGATVLQARLAGCAEAGLAA